MQVQAGEGTARLIRVEDGQLLDWVSSPSQSEFRNVQITPYVRKLPLTRDQRISLWYRQARVGLFIPWGLNTGNFDWKIEATTPPPCTTSDDLEEVTRQEGWSAQKWVQTAKEIGAQYIILATFHSTCGYLRIWPSTIPGTQSTNRDYLQEILDATYWYLHRLYKGFGFCPESLLRSSR